MKKLIGLALIVLAFNACKFNDADKPKLPIMGNRDAVTKTVNGKEVVDTVYQTIPDFKFANQYGDTITQNSLKAIYMWPISFSPPALQSALLCTAICLTCITSLRACPILRSSRTLSTQSTIALPL